MLTRIHVNQHNIRANAKDGGSRCVLTAKNYKQNRKGQHICILDAEGHTVAEIVYRPDRPLTCGAKCWVQTRLKVTVD